MVMNHLITFSHQIRSGKVLLALQYYTPYFVTGQKFKFEGEKKVVILS